MKFLLIGGQPDSGKSETLCRLFLNLSLRYTAITNVHTNKGVLPTAMTSDDFSAILVGTDSKGMPIKILMHSPNDDVFHINMMKNNIASEKPDIVICSIRDIGWERQMVIDIVATNYHFEIPLARVTRRHKYRPASLDWYRNIIDTLIDSVLVQTPFFL